MLTEKDDRLIVQVERETKDNEKEMDGWTVERNFWSKVLNAPPCPKEEIGVEDKDGLFRHVISEGGENAGWLLKCGAAWHSEPLEHVKSALKTHGFTAREAGLLIGWGTLNPWKLVNKPFQPEYTGNREWNRDAAQLRFTPSEKDMDDLQHPSWTKVLQHCGKALDGALSRSKWAQENGVVTGADYLKCWIASLFQFPMEPLPYLFLYGPQNTGKSTLHEALALLMKNGYARADNALINPQGFNAELANKVLCVVEEIDLRKAGATAYNRIKDWVTGKTLPIHAKGATPFVIPNSTKWIQTANDPNACPVFSGDTRITMIHVAPLPDSERIPNRSTCAANWRTRTGRKPETSAGRKRNARLSLSWRIHGKGRLKINKWNFVTFTLTSVKANDIVPLSRLNRQGRRRHELDCLLPRIDETARPKRFGT